MSELLSKEEIDMLLKGVETGEIETEEEVQEGEDILDQGNSIREYDITGHENIISARMPGLEMMNERFAIFLKGSLSPFLRQFVEISINNVEMMKFSEFMKTITLPSSINLFTMEPLKGYALLVMEPSLVYALVEFYFGGSTVQPVSSEARKFTPIEQKVIKSFMDIALKDLTSSWEELVPIKAVYAGTEMNPQFVSILNTVEFLIKVDFVVEVKDFQGKFFLCISHPMIEPVKDRLYSGTSKGKEVIDEEWIGILKDKLGKSYVSLAVDIGETELTVEELLSLNIGDVINLSKSIHDKLIVKVEGIPKFESGAGLSKGSQAIKIAGFV